MWLLKSVRIDLQDLFKKLATLDHSACSEGFGAQSVGPAACRCDLRVVPLSLLAAEEKSCKLCKLS